MVNRLDDKGDKMIEVDLVVEDAIAAYDLYEEVFNTVKVNGTNYKKGDGLNEVIFLLEGVQFHLLDASSGFGFLTPVQGETRPIWINLILDDAKSVYQRAIQKGFNVIFPLTDMPEFGLFNGVIEDPFGHRWVLEELYREISFEERTSLLAKKFDQVKGE